MPQSAARPVPKASPAGPPGANLRVALLTAGEDKPYALGLASALLGQGVYVDFIGSDEVTSPEVTSHPLSRFLNLRGDQRRNASPGAKVLRLLRYYARLIGYAAVAKPKVFHILWNNRFEHFDRTVLMLYYRLLGRRLVFTAHNVNAGQRDFNDTFLNRATLRIQYRLAHHLFVHTPKMKAELLADFGLPPEKVTVIPFGINNTLPNTQLTSQCAKEALGLSRRHRTLLFFGNVAPYKGLEYLIAAFARLTQEEESYRLIIAGAVKNCREYWDSIQQTIEATGIRSRLLERIEYIPDEKAECYFKAADVLVLPYTRIFQSGVLFLGYSFGLPVIAADVGSLRDEVVEGQTGWLFRPQDAAQLAGAIRRFFASDLFARQAESRQQIKEYANERYSWTKVATATTRVYSGLIGH